MKPRNLPWEKYEKNMIEKNTCVKDTEEGSLEGKSLQRQRKTLRTSASALLLALLIALSSCGTGETTSQALVEQEEVTVSTQETEQGDSSQEEAAQDDSTQSGPTQGDSQAEDPQKPEPAESEAVQEEAAKPEASQAEPAESEAEAGQDTTAPAESDQPEPTQSVPEQPEQPEPTEGDAIDPPEQQDASKTQGNALPSDGTPTASTVQEQPLDISSIPPYSGKPYVALNGNVPGFSDSDLVPSSFETYSEMDSLGRCGTAYACIGTDLMPTEERGAIGQVRPSGWHTVKYDIIDGIYLYNRCHLIAYQLAGENANENNLVTGTRYLNMEGMLPFEEMVADYVKGTGNHVLYRVTPVFEGDNLLASGIHMEAESVEDKGDGILFNVYCYNVQPGIRIDYASGDSELDESAAVLAENAVEAEASPNPEGNQTGASPSDGLAGDAQEPNPDAGDPASTTYILNTNTHKFHYPSCPSVDDMSEKNKEEYTGTREDVIAMGYDPCKRCNP